MKLGPLTKLAREDNAKKIDDNVMSTNRDNIVIFPIYGQSGAIQNPDSRRIVCKTFISINSNPLS